MAMTTCRECGKPVADSAQSCPNCGVTSPGGLAQLEVRRTSRLQGGLVPMSVWIDSEHMADLRAGKSVSLTVAPGIHRIECQLQQAHNKGGAQEVEVPAGKRLVVVVTLSRWNGKPDFTSELE